MKKFSLILAIESAIGGGSLSLSRDETQIDKWIGEGGVSRAEDLLSNIDQILTRNDLPKSSVTRIVVSVGPGSFTGIRIGLATAMGLATALNIDLVRISILCAMATHAPDNKNVLTAVPVGRGVICTQRFRKTLDNITALDKPTAIPAENFDKIIPGTNSYVIVPQDIVGGLANCLVTAANDVRISQTNEPLFIAKPVNL